GAQRRHRVAGCPLRPPGERPRRARRGVGPGVGGRDPRADLRVLALHGPRRLAARPQADPAPLLRRVPRRVDLHLRGRGASGAEVSEPHGQPRVGQCGGLRDRPGARRQLRRPRAVPPGVVPRQIGAGALRGRAAPPHPVRSRLDHGGSGLVAASPRTRLLRHPRAPRRRTRHHAGSALPPLGDTLAAPDARAHPRPAHGRGPGRGRHRARGGSFRMTGRAPLAGIRVADFTWVWAGPFCTLQLAHLGAEVIRVETATRLCVTRLLPPYPDMQPGTNRSGYFNQYNQGKKSITLDLKRPEAVEVARRLCAASDVVAENFAAGVMDRVGLGYETLRQLRPNLIMIALSGDGATGPGSGTASFWI